MGRERISKSYTLCCVRPEARADLGCKYVRCSLSLPFHLRGWNILISNHVNMITFIRVSDICIVIVPARLEGLMHWRENENISSPSTCSSSHQGHLKQQRLSLYHSWLSLTDTDWRCVVTDCSIFPGLARPAWPALPG